VNFQLRGGYYYGDQEKGTHRILVVLKCDKERLCAFSNLRFQFVQIAGAVKRAIKNRSLNGGRQTEVAVKKT
jgi:hypothetical protein